MPEIPDLEIFAKNLAKRFIGKRLEKVEVKVPARLNISPEELKAALEGCQLKKITRQGKTLLFAFDKDKVLGLHLMLHGEIRLLEKDLEVKFVILELHFEGDEGFALTDFQRRATPTFNPEKSKVPDAMSKEMTVAYLKQILSTKRMQIKQALLDQKLIRGIGNAYVDEILWAARISPFSISKAIPEERIKTLHKAIKDVLQKAIKHIQKEHPDQLSGEIRDFLKIHNPKVKKSPEGAEIMVDKKGSRRTYYTKEQELFQNETG